MYVFDVEGTIYSDCCVLMLDFLPHHLIMKFVQEQLYEI